MIIDNVFVNHSVEPDLWVDIVFRKDGKAENGGVTFEIVTRHHCTLVLVHELIHFLGFFLGTKYNIKF